MNDKIKNFMEYVSSDEALKLELKATLENVEKDEQVSGVIQFAKEHGYALTEEDFLAGSEGLSDDELEAVCGGGGCGCVIGGSGDGDGLNCGCFAEGIGSVGDKKGPSSQGGCLCSGVGIGATRRH